MAIGNPSRGLSTLQPLNEGSAIGYSRFIVGYGRLGTTWAVGDGSFTELGANARFG